MLRIFFYLIFNRYIIYIKYIMNKEHIVDSIINFFVKEIK